MSLIKIENASLGYEGKTVVNDISVDIKEKDYICIVGENGSGKTTLMKALLGLLKPLSGSITYSDGLNRMKSATFRSQAIFSVTFLRRCKRWCFRAVLIKNTPFSIQRSRKKLPPRI